MLLGFYFFAGFHRCQFGLEILMIGCPLQALYTILVWDLFLWWVSQIPIGLEILMIRCPLPASTASFVYNLSLRPISLWVSQIPIGLEILMIICPPPALSIILVWDLFLLWVTDSNWFGNIDDRMSTTIFVYNLCLKPLTKICCYFSFVWHISSEFGFLREHYTTLRSNSLKVQSRIQLSINAPITFRYKCNLFNNLLSFRSLP